MGHAQESSGLGQPENALWIVAKRARKADLDQGTEQREFGPFPVYSVGGAPSTS